MMRITQFHKIKQEDNLATPSLRGVPATRQSISLKQLGLLRHFIPRNDSNKDSEHGGVIIWIFVMIAIFAALNFAMTQGSRSGAENITKEQARIAATDILDYGRLLKQTVQTLQINACSDTEISFENSIVSGYANPNAPADKSCHVFDIAGGGINYMPPDERWLDGLATSQSTTHYGTWFTNANIWIAGLGKDGVGSACSGGATDGSCRELLSGLPFIQKDICMAINKKIGWGTDDHGTPYKDTTYSYGGSIHTNFTGTYANGHSMGNFAIPAPYTNIMTGCIEGDTHPPSGTYSFFQVLIVR